MTYPPPGYGVPAEPNDPPTDQPYGSMPPPPGYGPAPQAGYGHPQPGYGGYGRSTPPDSYLAWAILTTVLCCLPFGVVAIINASKVNSLFAAGDYVGAQVASARAKKWSIVSAVVYVVIVAAWLLLLVVLGGSSAMSGATPS